jgi:hypothetical protein
MKKSIILALSLIFWSAAAFASQPAYILDLRDLMDAHYGAGSWVYRTAPGNGTDIGPALQDGKNAIYALPNRAGKILIPPGNWEMTTPVDDLSGIILEGVASTTSVVFFNSGTKVAFNYTGALSNGGGIHHLGILLESGFGQSSSYGILMRGNAQFQPDQMEFDDIYMSAAGGSSFWWDGVHVDGTARSSPQGVRVSSWNNIQVFNCHNVAYYLANAVQFTMQNIGAYTGQGTNGNRMVITGGTVQLWVLGLAEGVAAGTNYGASSNTWINGQQIN